MTTTTTRLLESQLRNLDLGEEDRISELPDSLIHHILGFLPTKCVVLTSVLSQRWKNLWIHVPAFEYSQSFDEHSDEEIILETNRFMDFMDRVLILRNMATIRKFSLTYDDYFDNYRVKEWIAMAVKCKVEEVILSMGYGKDTVPICLFTSESLVKLEIEFGYCCILDLPQSMFFPRLKILRMTGIIFEDEILVNQLFSSCPLLEDLCLIECELSNINLISISTPTLKSFTLSGVSGGFSKLKIDAPNLMSIKYSDWLPVEFVADEFPSLVHADLCFLDFFRNNSDFHTLSKFVMKLSNVQHLRLTSGFIGAELISLVNVLSASIPTFEKLVQLETEFIQANTLLKFLQFTPNLESLVVIQKRHLNIVTEEVLPTNAMSCCMLLHLKTIKVQKFEGLPEELKLVEYFLKNAKTLQELIMESEITSKFVAEPEKKTQIMELLLMSPRASTNCMVKFLSS